jgi:hypothetical protein
VYCAGEKGNISEATASLNQRTLRRVTQNMVKRVNAWIQKNGGHFQDILWTVFQVLLCCGITNWNVGCVLEWTLCICLRKHRAVYVCILLPTFESTNKISQNVVWRLCHWKPSKTRFDPRQRREDFSCGLCVQTCCGAHPAPFPVGIGVLSPG